MDELRAQAAAFRGVPADARGQLWLAWMTPLRVELMSRSLVGYGELVRRAAADGSPCAVDVNKDVDRTHLLSSAAQLRALRRVLLAYSLRNESVGYCQGMNLLAAVLLLVLGGGDAAAAAAAAGGGADAVERAAAAGQSRGLLRADEGGEAEEEDDEDALPEEDAFWTLAVVIEVLWPEYHSQTMTGMQADQRVLASLLAGRCPAVWRHLRRLAVPLAYVSTQWCVALWVHSLEVGALLPVWDAMLASAAAAAEAEEAAPDSEAAHGGAHERAAAAAARVFMGVGLALFVGASDGILQAQDPASVMAALRVGGAGPPSSAAGWAAALVEPPSDAQAAFLRACAAEALLLSERDIVLMRRRFADEVQAELQDRVDLARREDAAVEWRAMFRRAGRKMFSQPAWMRRRSLEDSSQGGSSGSLSDLVE